MRYEYRVTKYDPRLRDEQGRYTRVEWTFFAQVGKRVAGRKVTMQQYLKTERTYLTVLEAFLKEADVSALDLRDLEITSRNRMQHSVWYRRRELTVPLAIKFSRLALRERVWGRLIAPRRAYVHFGWDYYMYVGLSRPTPIAIDTATALGLYIETHSSPYARAQSSRKIGSDHSHPDSRPPADGGHREQ